MFRLWGKVIKNNNIISDHVFNLEASGLSAHEKLDQGLESLCYHFDIQKPIWLKENSDGIARIGKTRFFDYHFIEENTFDYFEIEIIEDKK